ncbi:GTP cyclohydrolase I FolE [Mycetocola zhadangensis]|uniref:GTP cyclohydrolase 1 n=1 Tax=Mycetocola zhadangensis TaxID=1164595 RepID=A0A3L7J7W5_9MICO|nr:GTP cyclohydrolase I FolE [Mycetocola zhadangensis]RLQ84592.1 GTP cyclohydrolase I FolE [Mycetocola zhadangensis]GGE91595.1 GTP cyclohydrolase 1 [Mycetocola zhadangensis]
MAGVDKPRIEAAVVELLAAIGEDSSREGLARTPARVAEAYAEFFAGLDENPLEHLRESVPVGDAGNGEVVLLRDIAFRSICEHHLLPFLGTAHVAYLPSDRVVGLGRLPLVVNTLASRPQLQERLTEQIADALEQGLRARGVLVVLDAVHGCVTARGPRQAASSTVTVASRGELTEPARRAEIFAMIGSSTTDDSRA